MGQLSSRTREVDYDTYLSGLQDQISARQTKLQQIRLRERRANALFITYGLGLWVLYVALWWFGIFETVKYEPLHVKVAKGLPVGGGPVVIIFARRFLRWFYHRKQEKEETQLKALTKKKQDKVEEIKKKTGYYTTRQLIEKYDEGLKKAGGPPGSAAPTPAKQPAPKSGIPFPSQPGTPARPATALGFSTPQQQQQQTPQHRGPASQSFPPPGAPLPPQAPSTPQPRTFMDKFADALLGVAPEDVSPNSKYALICGRCFNHNGLVPPEDFDYIQYQCPRCGYLNPRRRNPPPSSHLAPSSQSHRRVQSEFGPSPLQFSSAPSSQAAAAVAGLDPAKLEQIEQERAEEREVAKTLLPEEDVGEGRGSRKGRWSTALREGAVASRRKGRKTVDSDEEEGGEENDDRMDTDE
ncbi:hypothetical protein JCM8547_008632 [Rhodosporidiobolus lusitaniae]